MADIPAIVNYQTKFCAENMQPVFNVCYGALDMASTPADGRTALDVYSKAEAATLSYVNGTFAKTSGATMSGPLDVIAGATGTQAPQVQEVVKKSGDTMTGPLEVPAGASGDQVMRASEVASAVNLATPSAWCVWDNTTGIVAGNNIGTIVRGSAGSYQLTFATPLDNNNYVVLGNVHAADATLALLPSWASRTVTGFTIATVVGSGAATDVAAGFSLLVFGGKA